MKIKTFGNYSENPLCSSYLIENDNEAFIIDPGCFEFSSGIIRGLSKDVKLKGIILTHCHIDHMLYAKNIANYYNIPIIASKKDKLLAFSFPIQYGIYFQWHKQPNVINGSLKIDQYIDDGDTLTLGSLEIQVISTPGHSPGSIMLYIPKENILFSGDTIFKYSHGRTDFPLSSEKDFIKSINSKVKSIPRNTFVYSGHSNIDNDYFMLDEWINWWNSFN